MVVYLTENEIQGAIQQVRIIYTFFKSVLVFIACLASSDEESRPEDDLPPYKASPGSSAAPPNYEDALQVLFFCMRMNELNLSSRFLYY